MELTIEIESAAAVVSSQDTSLDVGNNTGFVDAMVPVMERHRNVVLDMSTINFVDSFGLGSIMLLSRRFKTGGGDLKLCGLTAPVVALFEMVRMNRVFDIHPSRGEALSAFTSES